MEGSLGSREKNRSLMNSSSDKSMTGHPAPSERKRLSAVRKPLLSKSRGCESVFYRKVHYSQTPHHCMVSGIKTPMLSV